MIESLNRVDRALGRVEGKTLAVEPHFSPFVDDLADKIVPDSVIHRKATGAAKHGLNDGSACEVCGAVPERALHRDHNHVTGKMRGRLCHNCNIALGHAKDSIARLIALATYLKRYE